jgi:hypothetical protein
MRRLQLCSYEKFSRRTDFTEYCFLMLKKALVGFQGSSYCPKIRDANKDMWFMWAKDCLDDDDFKTMHGQVHTNEKWKVTKWRRNGLVCSQEAEDIVLVTRDSKHHLFARKCLRAIEGIHPLLMKHEVKASICRKKGSERWSIVTEKIEGIMKWWLQHYRSCSRDTSIVCQRAH